MTQPDRLSRRHLLQASALAGGAIAAHSLFAQEDSASISISKDSVILFQGDSITDAGRDRDRKGANDPRGLGDGYPFLVASELLTRYARQNLQCYNRGISGNKVPDLSARWQPDCLDLRPDVLSILIGVNDIWHKLNGNYDGSVGQYETGFMELLDRTRQALPETRLVICEPFVLRCGAVNNKWFPEFDERRAACKRVAMSVSATWVPFQEMFDAAIDRSPANYWAGDGVHPSIAGHELMAQTWIRHAFPPKSKA